MTTPKTLDQKLEESAEAFDFGCLCTSECCHRPLFLVALREAAEAARSKEREALRKRHLFGNEENGEGVYLEWRGRRYGKGPVLWAITRRGYCLNKSGDWDYEPMPSSRDDAFIERCRWISAEDALAAWDARSRPKEPKP